MAGDKYSAVWVSHTSMSDFLKCPRAYFLKNVYKDPKTGHKMQLMAPALALGQAVHEVIESLSVLPTQKRFSESLLDKYERAWKKVTGVRGGFTDSALEATFKEQGAQMLRRVMQHHGPLDNLAVKIQEDLPHYWLSEEDGIILCGKVDWLEYQPSTESVHIIDFKTSKSEEQESSLQLPIYHLLVHNTQKYTVSGASYWYLRMADEPVEKELPDLEEAHEQILEIAKKMKLARKLELFKCKTDGCFACTPMERVLRGEAEFVGLNQYRQDVYILPSNRSVEPHESVIL
jgi:ATP-dependent helicase/DNAse subunit B